MQIKLSPFFSDIVATTATSVITIVATVLVIRWLAQGLGPEEFGVYSLARRMVSTVIPLITLAMGVALTRFLGIHHGHRPAQSSYFWGATLIAVSLTTIAVLLRVPMSERFSIWIFHD